MNVAIMQPCYLPWHGYFSLMHHADVFVHLDDVALPTGRTYQTRIGVKTSQGKSWLTVPIKRSAGRLIRDVETVEDGWRRKHSATLKQLFPKSSPPIIAELMKGETHLAILNISLTHVLAAAFGLQRKQLRSSDLHIHLTGSDRILELCRALGAKRYITAHGSRNYLDHEAFERANIDVLYLDYCLTEYPQPFGSFDPFVSALSLLEFADNPRQWLHCELIPWRDFTSQTHAVTIGAAIDKPTEE